MTAGTDPRVSCIVPAYNEGARIGAVLAVLAAHPLVDEIVVVDDASTDDTAAVAATFAGVTIQRLDTNGGKTRALARGLDRAAGQVLLLIDADLQGLDGAAVSALLLPVLNDRADVAISLRRNAPRLWHLLGIDYISGERAMRRDILSGHLADLDGLPGFGFEVWLNALLIQASVRIAVVPWDGVASPAKARKRGVVAGVVADLRMLSDMFRTVSPMLLIHQIVAMRRLRVP